MNKYRATGLVDHVNTHKGNYSDLPNEIDYHENVNQVLAARDAFVSLPAEIRGKFHNNPAEFLAFIHNPENAKEIQTLGLGPVRPDRPDPPEDPATPATPAAPPAPATPATAQ